MRIYKNRRFTRFAEKEGISDAKLCGAVQSAEAGKIDADYGGGVVKQRIARPGKGNSAATDQSFYTVVATRLSLFMGFQKVSGKT
jgi:hypothetical protein